MLQNLVKVYPELVKFVPFTAGQPAASAVAYACAADVVDVVNVRVEEIDMIEDIDGDAVGVESAVGNGLKRKDVSLFPLIMRSQIMSVWELQTFQLLLASDYLI
jgi:hypothetical protein